MCFSPCNQGEMIVMTSFQVIKRDVKRMSRHPAVTQHLTRWFRSRSMRGIYGIHTSSSSFVEHRDLRLDLGLHSSLPFVCLGDFVNIWLLPGHFLHERLQGTTTRMCPTSIMQKINYFKGELCRSGCFFSTELPLQFCTSYFHSYKSTQLTPLPSLRLCGFIFN